MIAKRTPWILSALGLVAILALVGWYFFQTPPTPRTALSLNPENLAALSLPSGIDVIPQTEPGNAGEIYSAAAKSFSGARIDCEKFASDPTGDPPKIIAEIVSASHKASTGIFTADPGIIINYDSEHPALNDLEELGRAMDKAGLFLRQRKRPDQAKNYFQAVYALGLGLYRERLVYDEYLKGMGLMNESSQGLSECEPPNSPQAAALLQQSSTRLDYDAAHVTPIYTILSSIDVQIVATNAGDVFAFATDSQDRLFRDEAILKLGRYRFDAARTADQLAAPITLQKLLADPDLAIHTAADAALNLTIEQYRTIH